MVAYHQIDLPQGLSNDWNDDILTQMAHVSYGLPHMWLHAIGDNWQEVITIDGLKELFRRL